MYYQLNFQKGRVHYSFTIAISADAFISNNISNAPINSEPDDPFYLWDIMHRYILLEEKNIAFYEMPLIFSLLDNAG